ncbi:hypothetical protein [Morganella morganii]|uniref:hypothetical protein n=1 Tax=Morganella morganii TaxID=582 RepID=UPI00339CFAEA
MKTWTPNENITQVMLAFGPPDIEKFLPKWDIIPDEFKQGKNPWVAFIERWFYDGLECRPAAKEGIELPHSHSKCNKTEGAYAACKCVKNTSFGVR